MSINTYVELDKVTVSGSSTTFIEFLNIPQTYTDLVVKVSARSTNSTILSLDTRFNGDTSNAYSRTYYFTSGSGGFSAPEANASAYQWAYPQGTDTPTGTFCSDTLYLNNYTSSINPKPLLSRSNQGLSVNMISGQWRSSSAITSIRMALATGTLVAGSTISLYGIKAWANTEASPKATGGYVYSDTNYWYHAFPFSSTFTPNQSITADILQIAGGGGGGAADGGGGGAGGLLAYTSQSLTAISYAITVGGGGAGSPTDTIKGGNGGNSQFASLTASIGGGGGGSYSTNDGASGGSGGGGSGDKGSGSGSTTGGGATSGQGFAGGNGFENTGVYYASGGGGGSTAIGQTISTNGGGNGGAGSSTYSSWATATMTGSNREYAGGGGGGGTNFGNINNGGLGSAGGGNGGYLSVGTSAAATTGSGGGGGSGSGNYAGGSGGSGIVIVRYAK